MRRCRWSAFASLAGATLAAVALVATACVDLFHSTDFTTLCALDAAACGADVVVDVAPSDAARPLIDFCAWSPSVAIDHAERTCAWLGACEGVLPRTSFAECMLRARSAYDCAFNPSLRPRGRTAELWSCLASARSCDDVGACVFGGPSPTCIGVEVGAFTRCSPAGNTVIECALPEGGSPPTAVAPCDLEGRTCVDVDPSRAACTGKTGGGCADGPRCDGTHVIACETSLDVGVDCAAYGSGACAEDDAGVACVPTPTAPPCGDGGGGEGVRCDDAGVAHRCVAGRDVILDCSKLGQICVGVEAGAAIALGPLAPLAACAYPDAGERCTADDECRDDILRSCAAGIHFEVSCAKHQLGPCSRPPAGRATVPHCSRPR